MSIAKSTAQKIIEGHPNKALLRPSIEANGTPKKPRGITGQAEKFWDKYVPQLVKLGLATEIDGPALEQLCFWQSVWCEAKGQLSAADYSTTATARIVNAASKAYDNFRRLAQHFGMTPLSRNALTLEPPEETDEFFQS